jgi:hypothetical protein
MEANLMALLKAGWWPTTWWASGWWQEDWWLEYGTALPPVTVTVGDVWITRPVSKPKFPVYLLTLIRDYLESKVKNDG